MVHFFSFGSEIARFGAARGPFSLNFVCLEIFTPTKRLSI